MDGWRESSRTPLDAPAGHRGRRWCLESDRSGSRHRRHSGPSSCQNSRLDDLQLGVPSPAAMAGDDESPKDASAITRALNRAVLDALPFDDTRDFDDARRGFVGSMPEVELKNGGGRVGWTLRGYAFNV